MVKKFSEDCLQWHHVEILFWVVNSSEKNRLVPTSGEDDQSILSDWNAELYPTGSFQNYLLLKREFLHGVNTNICISILYSSE